MSLSQLAVPISSLMALFARMRLTVSDGLNQGPGLSMVSSPRMGNFWMIRLIHKDSAEAFKSVRIGRSIQQT